MFTFLCNFLTFWPSALFISLLLQCALFLSLPRALCLYLLAFFSVSSAVNTPWLPHFLTDLSNHSSIYPSLLPFVRQSTQFLFVSPPLRNSTHSPTPSPSQVDPLKHWLSSASVHPCLSPWASSFIVPAARLYPFMPNFICVFPFCVFMPSTFSLRTTVMMKWLKCLPMPPRPSLVSTLNGRQTCNTLGGGVRQFRTLSSCPEGIRRVAICFNFYFGFLFWVALFCFVFPPFLSPLSLFLSPFLAPFFYVHCVLIGHVMATNRV